jgi:outer membrane protein insertion porin family
MIFLCGLLAAGLYAQMADDWYYNKNIRKIEFTGLKNVRLSDVEGVTKSFVGKPFTDDLYSDILSRIYALEFFDDITPSSLPADTANSTLILRFEVVERPIVSRITFSGNKQIRTTELKEKVSLKEKDVFVSTKVLLDERAIRDHYLGSGYTDVSVSSRTVAGENGVSLTFIIDEGAATVVSSILFQGNRVFPERTLKGKLETKEAGFLRKGVFQESLLEKDKQTIQAYYHDRGYIDAIILDVTRELAFNEKESRNELTIVFIIQEGAQYTYGGSTFTGNEIFPTEKLESLITLKSGDVFNQTKFQGSVMTVADLYYENGYTANTFQPEAEKNTERRQVFYHFTIVERPRSHIENIIIRGNDKTKDYVILRELPIESGDIFSKAKITNGLRNLYNLQFFSAIVPDIVPGSEENLVELVFNVEEQSTTSVQFGMTFSGVTEPDSFPISLFLQFQDTNILGTGKTGSLNLNLAIDEQSATLGYGDSWVFGIPLDISVSASVSHKNLTTLQNVYFPGGRDYSTYYMNYQQLEFSLSAGVGRRWFPDFAIVRLAGGIGSSLLRNYYDNGLYEPYDSTIADYVGSFGLKNSVYAAFSLDGRDINYDPSKGWFTSQRISWTGLLPQPVENEFFLRTDTKAEGYITLFDFAVSESWSFKWVLAGFANLSFQFPVNEKYIGQTSKLYIDGMFNGRGWNSLYSSLRGEAMLSGTAELRMPLVPGLLSFDFFFDAAAIKPKAEDLFSGLALDNFYFSWGPGFRFAMPQFPLRFLFANTFKFDENNQFYWRNGKGPEWQFVLSFNIVNR